MNKSLVITVIGADRPGLVEIVAQTLVAYDANWLESRMANLAGRFAGMIEADVDESKLDALVAALHKLDANGLKVMVDIDTPAAGGDSFHTVQMELIGQDRVGIVREISAELARLGISIEQLETETMSAPQTGELLFLASADLHVPNTLDMDEVQAGLERIADELMVDIELDAPPNG